MFGVRFPRLVSFVVTQNQALHRFLEQAAHREVSTLDKADFELLEEALGRRRHQEVTVAFGPSLLLQLSLLVAGTVHAKTNLEQASDLGVVFAVGIRQRDPLMLRSVALLEIHCRDVEHELADRFVFKDTLIEHFQSDIILADFFGSLQS